jgi:hypothetical protein
MGIKIPSNLYYVVHRQTEDINGILEVTGEKTVTVYDIDTQSMGLVEVCNIECNLSCNSLEEIGEWMSKSPDWCFNNYKFINL